MVASGLIAAALLAAAPTDPSSLQASCPPTLVNRVVFGHEVISPRVPAADSFDAPDSGKAALLAKREEFLRADAASFTSLANQYCSALAGWAEIVPGTCQAGGPPPVCPANHWHRDPYALQRWSEKNRAAHESRLLEMKDLVCAARARELSRDDAKIDPSAKGFVPCSDGCPATMRCNPANDTCVEARTALQLALASPDASASTSAIRDAARLVDRNREALRTLSVDKMKRDKNDETARLLHRDAAARISTQVAALLPLMEAIERDVGRVKSGQKPTSTREQHEQRLGEWKKGLEQSITILENRAVTLRLDKATAFDKWECEEVLDAAHANILASAQPFLSVNPGSFAGVNLLPSAGTTATPQQTPTASSCPATGWIAATNGGTNGLTFEWRQDAECWVQLKVTNTNPFRVRFNLDHFFLQGTRRSEAIDSGGVLGVCIDANGTVLLHRMPWWRPFREGSGVVTDYVPSLWSFQKNVLCSQTE